MQHEREGEWGEGKDDAWTTEFRPNTGFLDKCNFCRQRLERQLENWKALSPEYPVSVLFTSTRASFVEFKFVDTEDGMSEWTYWIWHKFSAEKRKELGSTV
jgi:hypothetical protein